VISCVPLLYNTLRLEEAKDMKFTEERQIMREHNKAISVLAYLFLGITISGVLWYSVLPTETVGYLFEQQISTIADINNRVSGQAIAQNTILFRIFSNNLKVLIFSILFSFIFGAGAIFILTWNATVIAAAIGNYIKSNISTLASGGIAKTAGYFGLVSTGFFRYAIHGIPELFAYFYAALAGGIISVAIIKNHFSTKKASVLLLDIGELILIAIGFLIVAAIFEVYLTPVLF
jgi:uncharacterized membrane protein SpoIIM required for sporulation